MKWLINLRLSASIRGRFFPVFLCVLCVLCGEKVFAQPRSAGDLYRQLQSVTLDAAHVYRIRDAELVREDLHISLNEGFIAFTHAVDGRVTGAFFQGEGEVLLSPPDRVERSSLELFTGAAILDERFTTAYLRFNDDTRADLESALRPVEQAEPANGLVESNGFDRAAFLQLGDAASTSLAPASSLRLLTTFLNAETPLLDGTNGWRQPANDRFLHARLAGGRLGVFDIFFDSLAPLLNAFSLDQITVAHSAERKGTGYYDVWTAFPGRSARLRVQATKAGAPPSLTVRTQTASESATDPVSISHYAIRATVQPPTRMEAETTLDLQTNEAGARVLLFELSRYLQVKQVSCEGQALAVLQNQALEDSALARRGNDLVAVIFPAPLVPGRTMHLRFIYGGEVLSDAGGGLLTVGARGIWYPNRGIAMSAFDMEFHYPAGWLLVASGEPQAEPAAAVDGQVAHFVSPRPIPFAGFNLGRYVKTELEAGAVRIEAYAAPGVEASMPRAETVVITSQPQSPAFSMRRGGAAPVVSTMTAPQPQPREQARKLVEHTAATLDFLTARLGPFPYHTLALTQMPGGESQGWPGLINLSSLSFLTREERAGIHVGDPFLELLYGRLMPAHEVAHQWWGDLLTWKNYREQWLVEALANYSALLMIERQDPAAFRVAMEQYRHDLLRRTEDGRVISDAGPVTLGQRLNSSQFVHAYEAISYERGTWLLHMLRAMLIDARTLERKRGPAGAAGKEDDPFFAVLRRFREQHEGKEINTRELQQAFEDALPESMRYEGHRSLEWFFDNWVNGTALPALSLQGARIVPGASSSTASGKVVVKFAPKGLVTSVPIYGELPGQSLLLLGRVFAEGEATPFRFTVPAKTRRLLLDPFHTVLTRP